MNQTPGRRLALLAAAAIASVAVVLGACQRAGVSAPAKHQPSRVVLLGIDGASWVVMGPLIEQGQLPNFARLLRNGAHMPRFGTLASTDSPVVWTTVATGRDVADHAIRGYSERLPNGEVIPVSSHSRRAKAIWEVASELGVSVGVISWWASWPAEKVVGYVITDHANPALVDSLFEDHRYWTADPAELALRERDFFPLDLAPVLADVWLRKDRFPYDAMQRRGSFTPAQMEELRNAPWNERTPYSILKTYYAADVPLFSAAIRLHRERPVRLQMIYVRGPDPVQHYAWDRVEPEKYARRPATLERDRGMVEGVYRYLDGLLGELLGVLSADTWLLVASDHGAEPVESAGDPRRDERPGGHTAAAKGVLFIHGPHVRAGHVLERGNPADLMPTLAWLLGLPLSAELVGQPLLEAFDPGFAASRPTASVASYGTRHARAGVRSPEDEAVLESLRALGYIE
jgi:hypothetical protein